MDYDSDLDGADGEHNEYADMDDDKVRAAFPLEPPPTSHASLSPAC